MKAQHNILNKTIPKRKNMTLIPPPMMNLIRRFPLPYNFKDSKDRTKVKITPLNNRVPFSIDSALVNPNCGATISSKVNFEITDAINPIITGNHNCHFTP